MNRDVEDFKQILAFKKPDKYMSLTCNCCGGSFYRLRAIHYGQELNFFNYAHKLRYLAQGEQLKPLTKVEQKDKSLVEASGARNIKFSVE